MASRGSSESSLVFLLLLIVTTGPLLSCAAVTNSIAPNNVTVGKIPAVFMYGDSVLDTGNNNDLVTLFKSNFPPYGRNFPGRMPTGRFSDGRVISDFIVLSIPDQINLFQQYVRKLRSLVRKDMSNYIVEHSLHVISAGNDDIGLTHFLTGKQLDRPSYATFLVTQALTNLRQLYGLGARRIAVLSTTVTGCVPFSRTFYGGISRQCANESNELAMMFNDKLRDAIERLNDAVDLPNASITFVDVYKPLFDIISHPEKYGFAVAKEGCCGTGSLEFAVVCNPFIPTTCTNTSKYIYFDGVHPTEKAYKIVFSKIRNSIMKPLWNQI